MATVDFASPVLTSTHPPIDGAFGNTDVVLRTPEMHCYPGGCCSDSAVGEHQGEDGPVNLVIGRLAPDELLRKAANRRGVRYEDLRSFRDSQTT